jgi:hypothetical protein
VKTKERTEEREKEGHSPKNGKGRANQLASLTVAIDILPWRRKRQNPKMIPASMAVVWRNPRSQLERKETNKITNREEPQMLTSP